MVGFVRLPIDEAGAVAGAASDPRSGEIIGDLAAASGR
jgi:hypothetical protein